MRRLEVSAGRGAARERRRTHRRQCRDTLSRVTHSSAFSPNRRVSCCAALQRRYVCMARAHRLETPTLSVLPAQRARRGEQREARRNIVGGVRSAGGLPPWRALARASAAPAASAFPGEERDCGGSSPRRLRYRRDQPGGACRDQAGPHRKTCVVPRPEGPQTRPPNTHLPEPNSTNSCPVD